MTENNKTIGYQFIPMPKQLMHLLDVNLRSMLFALVDDSQCFADDEGWFFRENALLQLDSCLSKNLVIATIDTLFQLSLVEVSCIGTGKGKKPNNYKVNMDVFKLFEQLDMNTDIHRPENKIKTLDYKGSGYHASYLDDDPERFIPELVKGTIHWKSTKPTLESTPDDTNTSTKELTTDVTKSEHNIDNKEYIDNIYNLYNKEYINDITKNNNILYNNKLEEKPLVEMDKEKLVREFESSTEPMTGDSERKSKDEIGAEETPYEYQPMSDNPSKAIQDSVQGDFQNESGDKSSSSSSQSNSEGAGKQQEFDTSQALQSPLEEAVTGIKMVGLFDPEPSKDNQRKPILSVRAATRKWAEELEAKYQTRERTLQNLAHLHPLGFEKYVGYLRTYNRPAFLHHKELIHDLAVDWEIDVDLDLD